MDRGAWWANTFTFILFYWYCMSMFIRYMSVCAFIPIPYYFDCYIFVIYFQIKNYNAFSLFFLKIALIFQGLWQFENNFIMNFYISVENDIRILIGIELNLCITLSSIYILTVLIISVHEHRISFYLFVYFSIYFINVLC